MNSNTVLHNQSLGSKSMDLRDLKPDQMYHMVEPLMDGKGAQIEFQVKLILADGADEEHGVAAQLTSEFVGTFMLVVTVGLNVVMKSPATAWSAAAALMSMIYSLGDVSGAHFNPSVTLAVVLCRRGKCHRERGVSFIATQIAAGTLAGILYAAYHSAGPYKGERFALQPGALSSGLGTFSWSAVLVAEMVFTGMLAFVVLAVATTTAPPSGTTQNFHFALAIGACVTAGGFAIGAISGGALNPAVSFGIATAASANWGIAGFGPPWYYCLYFSAFQLAGGVFAALLFHVTHQHEFSKAAQDS